MIFITLCSFMIRKMQGWDLPWNFRHMPLRAKEWLFNAIPNVDILTGMQIPQRNILCYIAIIFTSVRERRPSVWLDTVTSTLRFVCICPCCIISSIDSSSLGSCTTKFDTGIVLGLKLFLLYTPQKNLIHKGIDYFARTIASKEQ